MAVPEISSVFCGPAVFADQICSRSGCRYSVTIRTGQVFVKVIPSSATRDNYDSISPASAQVLNAAPKKERPPRFARRVLLYRHCEPRGGKRLRVNKVAVLR